MSPVKPQCFEVEWKVNTARDGRTPSPPPFSTWKYQSEMRRSVATFPTPT